MTPSRFIDALAAFARLTRGEFPFYYATEYLRRKTGPHYQGQTRSMKYEGITLEVEPSKYIGGKLWWAYGRELRLMKWAHETAGRGTFIDVGACLGEWSYYMARRFRRVVAFEPNPDYGTRLRVPTHPYALGQRFGRIGFTTDDPDNEGRLIPQEGIGTVPMAPLDEFELEPALIKIDTEGMEREVLEGARQTIIRSRPIVVLEDNKDGAVGFLQGLGYKVSVRMGENVGMVPT